MNSMLVEQIIQDMNHLLAESHYGKQKGIEEIRYGNQKGVEESCCGKQKAIEEIGKPLTKLGKPLRIMAISGSRFDTRCATTCAHGFTLLISSTHNLK
jgi:hypothetical protein